MFTKLEDWIKRGAVGRKRIRHHLWKATSRDVQSWAERITEGCGD